MGLLKNLRRRFRGGPDFNLCQEVTAVLEDTQLTLSLPASNVEAVEVPRNINFPYRQPGWFENNVRQSRQHHYVQIATHNWCFMPKGIASFFSELGMFSLSIQVKKILSEKMNAMELDVLGKYVVDEYDEYYNSPNYSEYSSLGTNTKIIKETQNDCRRNHPSFSEERITEQVALCLESRGYPPISPHRIKLIGKRRWVYYTEPDSCSIDRDNMYCFPMDESFYLCFNFRYRVDISNKFKLWKSAAEAAEKRIMESVRIESVGTKLLE